MKKLFLLTSAVCLAALAASANEVAPTNVMYEDGAVSLSLIHI